MTGWARPSKVEYTIVILLCNGFEIPNLYSLQMRTPLQSVVIPAREMLTADSGKTIISSILYYTSVYSAKDIVESI